MKTANVVASLAAIIVIIIVGLVAFRPKDSVAPTPEPTVTFQDASQGDASVDFEQTAPADESELVDLPGTTPSPSASDSATSDTITITIDEQGFTPSAITIAAGTTVTFVNNGQALHWPASDVHPTHQILPEFDAKRGLSTGQTYSFTFTQVGEWRMHDHLQAASTGTITVQ